MIRRFLGPLLLCTAAMLAWTGYTLPEADDAKKLFTSSHAITDVTIDELYVVNKNISEIEKNTKQLASSTKNVADVIPTEITLPLNRTFAIPGARELKSNADALARTADSVHTTSASFQNRVPGLIENIKDIDQSLLSLEQRTIRAMQMIRVLVWLISAVVAVLGFTQMSWQRTDLRIPGDGQQLFASVPGRITEQTERPSFVSQNSMNTAL